MLLEDMGIEGDFPDKAAPLSRTSTPVRLHVSLGEVGDEK
jgi:hypothetical protein